MHAYLMYFLCCLALRGFNLKLVESRVQREPSAMRSWFLVLPGMRHCRSTAVAFQIQSYLSPVQLQCMLLRWNMLLLRSQSQNPFLSNVVTVVEAQLEVETVETSFKNHRILRTFMPEVVPGSGFTGGYQPMEQFWTRSMWSRQELLRNAVIDAATVPLFENSSWNGGGDISMRLEFDFWIIRTIRNTEVFSPCNIHCPTLSDFGSLCTLQSSLGNQHAVSLWEGFQMTAKCTTYWLRLP